MPTPPRLTTVRAALSLALLVLAACSGQDGGLREARAAATPAATDGTRRMADTLAALADRARSAPASSSFLNTARASAIAAMLPTQSGGEALSGRFQLAQEMLNAGKPREAIRDLESLMRDVGAGGEPIEPRNRPLHDLLALSYLRLGEQDNCLTNTAANRCILPLAGGARHVKQEGARGAVREYERLLRSFPHDYGSRYLLNIAWMALGGYPDSVPAAWRIPGLAAEPGSRFPTFPNVAADVGLAVEGRAGGEVIDDFNGDGLLDVFMTSWGIEDPPHLFIADGKGGYVDRTREAGLSGINGGLHVIQADYDNDGDVDLFVLRGAWNGEAGRFPNSLLRNRGDGTFEDVTYAAGLGTRHPTQAGAWVDFDGDGWLDLFVGNENSGDGVSHPSELWHNNRDGTFTDVAAKVGIALDAFVKGATWGDVDDDGKPDLYVSIYGGPNRLYVNRGGTSVADWRFEEEATLAGVYDPQFSFPTWFWDFDDDGHDDLFVSSCDLRAPLQDAYARERLGLPMVTTVDGREVPVDRARLYRNRGDGTFEDIAPRVGLADKAIFAMGSNFGDLDNDGWLDVYLGTGNPDLRSIVPNRMFHNIGGNRLEEVTLAGGFGHIQKGHATAFADLDRDGDEDVFMVVGGAFEGDRAMSVLFANPGTPGRTWISLELEGTTANRSAIGARVELDVVDAHGRARTMHRRVGGGSSFGSGPLTLHVGLGDGGRVRAVRVRWPDRAGTRTSYGALEAGRFWHIREGDAPRRLERPPVPFRAAPAVATMTHAH